MATTVDRAMAKAAAALLPGLLPTPPRSAMILPCIIIPPASFASSEPKPCRADAVERWDARKNEKKPGSPASSSGSCSSGSPPGRASSCERWDINKKKSPSGSSTSSSSSSSRGSSSSPGRADAAERWDSNKRPPSRASSADRWDTHKKPRPAVAGAESQTDEQEIKISDETTVTVAATPARTTGRVFSGNSFFASPEPSMLPMPTFFISPEAGMLPVPAFLLAH